MALVHSGITKAQLSLVPEYINKWKNISLSTERINREQAEATIDSIYRMFGYEPPTILFFDSPYQACNFIANQTDKQLESLCGKQRFLEHKLHKYLKEFTTKVYSQIDIRKIYVRAKELGQDRLFDFLRGAIGVWEGIDYQIGEYIWQLIDEHSLYAVGKYFGQKLYRFNMPGKRIDWAVCQLDYLISIFRLSVEQEDWENYKSLMKLGNYIFFQENICIVCDRPTQMLFDSNNYLHAEGKPAISFADGFCLYSHHLVTIPEKYGQLYSRYWQARWLLEETNSQIREALFVGIGYKRICQELIIVEVKELFREEFDRQHIFILVRINNNIQFTTIAFLVEMDVNSKNVTRVKEVPCSVESVGHALSTVDTYVWGIKTEYFSNWN